VANTNQQDIVADNIKTNLLDKKLGRSKIIAGQNVGLAEAWARQTEAELIDGSDIAIAAGIVIRIEKEWVAIRDNRLRATHAVADGQVVDINDLFRVGSDRLLHPRDPNGSMKEIANCRCISNQRIKLT